MTDAEMDAIQVPIPPVFWQGALTPRFKLLGEALVEATDRAGTRSDSQQRVGHFPRLLHAPPSHKHLRQSLGDVGFIATVAIKDLGVELAFPISRHLEIFVSARRCCQIARIGAVAVAAAFGATLSPGRSNEGIQLLAHHQLQDSAHGALSQSTEMLMKFLLLRQWRGRWFRGLKGL